MKTNRKFFKVVALAIASLFAIDYEVSEIKAEKTQKQSAQTELQASIEHAAIAPAASAAIF